MDSGRTIIIVGHSGSGKTEFAVNYARRINATGISTAIADLDVVNPYFRAREVGDLLGGEGIRVISSNFPDDFHADTPALSAELRACFIPGTRTNIVDVGGDPAGTLALAQFAGYLAVREYEMWMTVNANRPRTARTEDVMEFIRAIEGVCGLHVTGLLNTTHMLGKTAAADLLRGDTLVRRMSEETGLPVKYTAVLSSLASEAAGLGLSGEVFPIEMIMRPRWLR